MIAYVDTHFAKTITIEKLSGEAGVSRFHFCRTFRKIIGMSPMSFVALKRVEQAKMLLRKKISVSSIAHMAGFSDLSSFNRHFKRLTGLTPTAYRDFLNQ
jgi:AraC family transcriptional regulator